MGGCLFYLVLNFPSMLFIKSQSALIFSSLSLIEVSCVLARRRIASDILIIKKSNRYLNKQSQTKSPCNRKVNKFIISFKGLHGEISPLASPSWATKWRSLLDAVYLMSAFFCCSSVLFLKVCNRITLHSWDQSIRVSVRKWPLSALSSLVNCVKQPLWKN